MRLGESGNETESLGMRLKQSIGVTSCTYIPVGYA